MKKENPVAKIEFNIDNFPKSVTDPKTGEKIKVTQSMIAMAISTERQITSGLEQIAMGLWSIREHKLFLLYNLDSMEAYLDKRFRFSRGFGYQLLKLADVFGDSKHFADIMRQPHKLLALAAKDDHLAQQLKEGEVTMSDGTVTTVADIEKNLAAKIVKDYEKTKNKNTQLSTDLDETKKKLKDVETVVKNYEDRAEVSDEYFKKITDKSAALREVLSIQAEASSMVRRLDSIDSEEATVVAELASTLSMVLAGFSQVQSKWMHLILDVDTTKKG